MKYQGSELELFQDATIWKKYFSKQMRPYLRGKVLEVGAGIGGNIQYLLNENITSWTALEPDQKLAEQIKDSGDKVSVVNGFLDDIKDEKFDTIIYLDVLEHIEDDAEEFQKAVNKLSVGGHLIVLCPAHNFLFSPFDKAIGHFRRYNKSMYRKFQNNSVTLHKLKYLDFFGFFLSFINSFFLSSAQPTHGQIQFWDKVVVRFSKIIDPLLNFNAGKSILGIWKKTDV